MLVAPHRLAMPLLLSSFDSSSSSPPPLPPSSSFFGVPHGVATTSAANPIRGDTATTTTTTAAIAYRPEPLRMRLHDPAHCRGCGLEIRERFLLRVLDHFWHEHCLRCVQCERPLNEQSTCYLKENRVYCKEDHTILFGSKCARCRVPLRATDYVYRSQQFAFHADCFRCFNCERILQKGDQYFCVDGQIVCQTDYEHFFPSNRQIEYSQLNAENGDFGTVSSKKTPKRPRTILNAAQRRAFKFAFEKGPKPSRKIREQLAKETGLSVRVVQVWFQNQRAKMKKEQRKMETNSKSIDSDGKDDELKSVGDSLKSDEESDSEEYSETLSGRSSTALTHSNGTLGPPDLYPNRGESSGFAAITPIDKLYEMQHTYFAFV